MRGLPGRGGGGLRRRVSGGALFLRGLSRTARRGRVGADCLETCIGLFGKELLGEGFRAQYGESSADEAAVDCGGCFRDVRIEVHNERRA